MIKTIELPYDKSYVTMNIDESNLKAVLSSQVDEYRTNYSEEEIVQQALDNPINTKRLRDLCKGKENVTIITSDHTRPVPSHITLPILLDEIRIGNPNAKIIILVATGLHRPLTEDEMIRKFSKKIVENEEIIIHNAFISEDMNDLGVLPSGSICQVNKLAVQAELLICEGFIEPHFFAGFSGGRKSILPGVSSKETVNANHSARAIAHPLAKTGILEGNPVHEDMLFAARKAGVDFILNVILNSEKKIIKAVSGELNIAHVEGCNFLKKLCEVPKAKADIVVTTNGGYPLDQNLYQCPKAISSAAECVDKDGIIIMVASCIDGVGGSNFEKLMCKGSPKDLMEYIKSIPDEDTISEQWCVQKFAQVLLDYKIILVTGYIEHDLVKKMNITPSSTIDEALEIAFEIKGRNASVVVIPDGISVIVN